MTLVLSAIILKYYITESEESRKTAGIWPVADIDTDTVRLNGTDGEQAGEEVKKTGQAATRGEDQDSKEAQKPKSKMSGQENQDSPVPEAEDSSQAAEAAAAMESDEDSEAAEEMMVRVLLKTDDFLGVFHQRLEITGTGDFLVSQGEESIRYQAGEVFDPEQFFAGQELQDDGTLILSSAEEGERLQILNLKRNQSPPAYFGTLEIVGQEDGYLVINELPLEQYLPSVLSSEMSSGFPLEALKAQAVSARTYALKRIRESGGSYYGADLDDSVSFQVYNNMPGDEQTIRAVEETAGLVLEGESGLADVSYFSTSSGVTGEDDFKTEADFRRFILEGRETDLERGEAWYRWSAQITPAQIRENLLAMGLTPPETVTGIAVSQRADDGQARTLEILGENSSLSVSGEYDIRQALSPGTDIILQDGSACEPMQLLPSAWFVIDRLEEIGNDGQTEEVGGRTGEEAEEATAGETAGETAGRTVEVAAEVTAEDAAERAENVSGLAGWRLTGGGFGHGRGMSQNGARIMAEQGNTFQDILKFYYSNSWISDSWDTEF